MTTKIREILQKIHKKDLVLPVILMAGLLVITLVITVFLNRAERISVDEPVYQFMDKKRAEGKPYRVYMMASANKFLRIYYATVKAYLESLEHAA